MLSVLYEDENILAIDKPAGLATIPERQIEKKSLSNLVMAVSGIKIFIVHRLDKDVSGVILFAKNAPTHRYLNEQFYNHLIKKEYLALVHGLIGENSGEISKPIRLYGSGRMGADPDRGKNCLTAFKVLERYKNHTLVNVFPLTGRRHQIRVHFYSIDHPLAGDLLYGDKTVQRKFPRLMLHAHKLEFKTRDGIFTSIISPVPQSFTDVISMIK